MSARAQENVRVPIRLLDRAFCMGSATGFSTTAGLGFSGRAVVWVLCWVYEGAIGTLSALYMGFTGV